MKAIDNPDIDSTVFRHVRISVFSWNPRMLFIGGNFRNFESKRSITGYGDTQEIIWQNHFYEGN